MPEAEIDARLRARAAAADPRGLRAATSLPAWRDVSDRAVPALLEGRS